MQAFRADVLTQIIKPVSDSNTNERLLDFFVYAIDFIYALTIGCLIYFSLNTPANKPLFRPYIYLISSILGILSIIVFIVLLVDLIRGLINGNTCNIRLI